MPERELKGESATPKLVLCVEASTLKNLDTILKPSEFPIRWSQGKWLDVLQTLELLVIAGKLTYSGMSAPDVAKATNARVHAFHDRLGKGNDIIYSPPDKGPLNEECKSEAIRAANEFFSNRSQDLLSLPGEVRGKFRREDILRAMPSTRDGDPKDPFNHVELWNECIDIILGNSDKNEEEWLEKSCTAFAEDTGEACDRFNGGTAILYGALKSEKAREVLYNMTSSESKSGGKRNLFSDKEFLRGLNVSYRTVFNLYRAIHRAGDFAPDTYSMYAPGAVRCVIFDENQDWAFRCSQSSSHQSKRDGDLLTLADTKSFDQLRRSLWQSETDLPVLGLLTVAKASMYPDGSGLMPAIVEMRGRTETGILRNALVPGETDKEADKEEVAEAKCSLQAEIAASVQLPELWQKTRLYKGIKALVGGLAGPVGGAALEIAGDWLLERASRPFDRALTAKWDVCMRQHEDVVRQLMERVFVIK